MLLAIGDCDLASKQSILARKVAEDMWTAERHVQAHTLLASSEAFTRPLKVPALLLLACSTDAKSYACTPCNVTLA